MSSLAVFSMYSPAAGSTRVRIYDWLRHVDVSADEFQYVGQATAGPGTLIRHSKSVMQAERGLRRFDPTGRSVLVSREASPLSRGGIEADLLGRAAHGVYDFDDALFNDDSFKRRLFGGERKFERAVTAADTVIAGNGYLADWATRFNDSVIVIPSCVEPADYLPARRPGSSAHPTLVWLGSASTEQFLVPIIDQLLHLHRTRGARLKLISSPSENALLASLAPMLDRVPWAADTFAKELADADVAIAPLADTAYSRGKCAYKILQYGAAELPVVGSPVGANELALKHIDGIAVPSPQEWAEAIDQLLDEPIERSLQRRENALAGVRTHYSFEAWRDRWVGAITGD